MKTKRFNYFVYLATVLIVQICSIHNSVGQEKKFLYVATPGIRNYEEYGGVGIIVFDVDNGYRFVKFPRLLLLSKPYN